MSKSVDQEGRSIEKRFAYNLLEKLLRYLEQASTRMKVHWCRFCFINQLVTHTGCATVARCHSTSVVQANDKGCAILREGGIAIDECLLQQSSRLLHDKLSGQSDGTRQRSREGDAVQVRIVRRSRRF